ncbi:MAG: hypothetical protein ABIH21_00625 [Patescibacteria group bacterium]
MFGKLSFEWKACLFVIGLITLALFVRVTINKIDKHTNPVFDQLEAPDYDGSEYGG